MSDKIIVNNLNQNLEEFSDDYFYHLYLGKSHNDLKAMFGDVQVYNC
jgi:hypothetical protein